MPKKTASTSPSEKKTATKKKSTAKKPVANKPVAKKRAAKKPAAKKPAAEKPAAKKPAAEKPAAKKPAANKPAAEKPAAKKPAAKKPATKKPSAKKPAAEKSMAKLKPVVDVPSGADNVKVVKDFIAALERLDFDAALALCAPNVIWINEPIKSAGSREQLGTVFRSAFGNVSLFRVEDLQIGQDPDGTVYTDRIDIIKGGGMSMRIRVKGVFNVQDGQISSWTDSFDWLEGTRQVLRSAPSILKFQLGKLRKRRG